MVEKLSITVTEQQASRIRQRVDSGEFASASEVVRTALALLERTGERDYESWLVSVRARVQAAAEDTRPRLSTAEVHESLLRHHAEAMKRGNGG